MQSSAQRVDDATILALHDAGKGCRQIADIIGDIGKSSIAKRLKHLTPRKTTEIYKTHRADILAEFQRKCMNTLDSAEIKKMQPRDRVMAMGIAYDKERVERGLSDASTRPLVVIQVKGDHAQIAVDNPVDNFNHNNNKDIP
jgi:hypothetical protein